jgi:hypothetical protein
LSRRRGIVCWDLSSFSNMMVSNVLSLHFTDKRHKSHVCVRSHRAEPAWAGH